MTAPVVGAALALVAGRFAEPLLSETSARDPLVLGSVATLLTMDAALASMARHRVRGV